MVSLFFYNIFNEYDYYECFSQGKPSNQKEIKSVKFFIISGKRPWANSTLFQRAQKGGRHNKSCAKRPTYTYDIIFWNTLYFSFWDTQYKVA